MQHHSRKGNNLPIIATVAELQSNGAIENTPDHDCFDVLFYFIEGLYVYSYTHTLMVSCNLRHSRRMLEQMQGQVNSWKWQRLVIGGSDSNGCTIRVRPADVCTCTC